MIEQIRLMVLTRIVDRSRYDRGVWHYDTGEYARRDKSLSDGIHLIASFVHAHIVGPHRRLITRGMLEGARHFWNENDAPRTTREVSVPFY